MKTGSAADRKSRYVFFPQLSFLSKCTGGVRTRGDTTNEVAETRAVTTEQVGGPYAAVDENEASISLQRKKKRKPASDDELLATLKMSIQSRDERDRQAESDDDRHFLLSLLPEMKKIPENVKLSTRMEILGVIEKNKRGLSQGFEINRRNYEGTAGPSQQYASTYGSSHQHWQNTNLYPFMTPNPRPFQIPPPQPERSPSTHSIHSVGSSSATEDYELMELFSNNTP